MNDLDQFVEQNRQKFTDELFELLRIPSISADSRHKSDIRAAANWIANQFRGLNLSTEVVETDGHPIVFAQSAPVPGAPTVLVYGHYDVQPPDPLDEWISPPFDPQVRDGNVYARGATDDKGQMFTHIKSAEAWIRTRSKLPVQLKFLIEGEEEVGSEAINKFLEAERERLACDIVVISDTSQFAPGQPAITYGLKGLAYFELTIRGPKQDLHSGTFGGAVRNPAIALCQILSGLIDEQGRVQIPGFYDPVIALSEAERQQFAALPFDEDRFRQQIGVPEVAGEAGYTTLERRWARPTFDINGIWGGYQGEGAKTVLPAKASAKFSFRLVPDQTPQQVATGLRQKLAELCPPGVTMELTEMHGAPGFVTSFDSPYMQAASRAVEHGFGKSPVFIREGGSIPIVLNFKQHLGADSLLLGWGQDDDNTHSPNEKFSLADFHRGILASTRLWEELAHLTPAQI